MPGDQVNPERVSESRTRWKNLEEIGNALVQLPEQRVTTKGSNWDGARNSPSVVVNKNEEESKKERAKEAWSAKRRGNN